MKMVYLYFVCVLSYIVIVVLNKGCVFKCMIINKCEDVIFLIDLKNEFRFFISNSNVFCFVLVCKLRCF